MVVGLAGGVDDLPNNDAKGLESREAAGAEPVPGRGRGGSGGLVGVETAWGRGGSGRDGWWEVRLYVGYEGPVGVGGFGETGKGRGEGIGEDGSEGWMGMTGWGSGGSEFRVALRVSGSRIAWNGFDVTSMVERIVRTSL